jgi:hypothetical protein
MVEMGLSEIKRLIKGLRLSFEMIVGAYASDEWRCVGKANNLSSPNFYEWHINCAIQYILAFRSRKDVWRVFLGCFGHIEGSSWKPVEARGNSEEVATCPFRMNSGNDLSHLPQRLSTRKACQYGNHRL